MAVLKSFCGVASLRHGTIGVGSFELAGIVTNLFSNEKIQTTGTVRDVVWIMIVLACIVALIVGAFKVKRLTDNQDLNQFLNLINSCRRNATI